HLVGEISLVLLMAILTTRASAGECRKIHDLFPRKTSSPTVLVGEMVEALVVFQQRFRVAVVIAEFAHEHPSVAGEHQRGDVRQTVGAKADGGFEQPVAMLWLKQLDGGRFVEPDQSLP